MNNENHAPADLAKFWNQTLEAARAVPLEMVVEPVAARQPHLVHRLTYRSLGGIPVRAYLSTPINNGDNGRAPARLPLVVTMPGYGGFEMSQTLGECQRGFAILQVYPRSQGESGDLWRVEESAYRAWVNHGKAHPEGFFYQGAVMDIVRAIDYCASRDDIDPTRIATNGTSQGGMLALQLASVDSRVSAVVSHVPYLCDVRHNPAFAQSLARDEVFLKTWDYFEPLHLAPHIRGATLLSAGGRDTTCPAETIHAVYDKLTCVRSIAHFPSLTHTSSGDFYAMGWEWITRNLR